MALDLFDDVFRLHLALESPQGTLDGFTVLKANFCQDSPPHQFRVDIWSLARMIRVFAVYVACE